MEENPRSRRRSPLPGPGDAAARSKVGGGEKEETRAGEPLGVEILRRNAPTHLRHRSPCQGNLGRLFSPQMGFLHVFSGNWGWGRNELMRLCRRPQFGCTCREVGRTAGWRGGGEAGGGQEVGTGLLSMASLLPAWLSRALG